jgi:hypothetical protein
MVTIFISYVKENAECAAQLRQGFEACGYTVWREPASLTIKSITYPRTIENAILSSAAIVLVWSPSAAQSEWVKQNIHSAQTLKKLIFPVALDGTRLPDELVSMTPITSQPSCENAVAALMTLPNFPTLQSADPLIKLYEQAASRLIREREAAINQASEMLKRGERQEAILVLLEYLARYDLMTDLKKKAQETINNNMKRVIASPIPKRSDDSRHIFGVNCENGHVTYFDKRIVCNASSGIVRGTKVNSTDLDELHLECGHSGCGVEVVAFVDCQDYRNTK